MAIASNVCRMPLVYKSSDLLPEHGVWLAFDLDGGQVSRLEGCPCIPWLAESLL
jgi:hypothetical protein